MYNIELFEFNEPENGFSFSFRAIRKDAGLWLFAKDICDYLELTDVTHALERLYPYERDIVLRRDLNLCPNSDTGVKILSIINPRARNFAIVSESGLYKLIFMSTKKDKAEKFRIWVTEVVLPSIRQCHAYIDPTGRELIREDFRNIANASDGRLNVNNMLSCAADSEMRYNVLNYQYQQQVIAFNYLQNLYNARANEAMEYRKQIRPEMCRIVDNTYKKTNIMDIINSYKGD